ncbi:MAG: hypothetical protein R3B98_04590 [Hyphomonas sp.]
MTPETYIDIALHTGDRLDTQWGLYISVHMALFGAILYVRRPLGLAEKIIGIGLYAIFGFYSLRIILSLRDLLERTAHQIHALQLAGPARDDRVLAYFTSLSSSGHLATGSLSIVAVHVIAFGLVAWVLLSGTSWKILRPRRRP